MAVVKSPFEAQHGFKSPGFTVDEAGNVTLRSVTYTVTEEATDVSGDYVCLLYTSPSPRDRG